MTGLAFPVSGAPYPAEAASVSPFEMTMPGFMPGICVVKNEAQSQRAPRFRQIPVTAAATASAAYGIAQVVDEAV